MDYGPSFQACLTRFRENTSHLRKEIPLGQGGSEVPRTNALGRPVEPKHLAVEVTRQRISDLPSPTSTSFLDSYAQRRERDNLVQWADSNGLIINFSQIVASCEDPGIDSGGAEHEAYLFRDGETAQVIRITRHTSYGHPWYETSASQYIKRLTEFSFIFPYAPICVLGIVIRDSGHPAIVTRQPFIYGTRIANADEFESALQCAGYMKEGAHRWMQVATGVSVEDVTSDNVFFHENGAARFFDVLVDSDTLHPETRAAIHGTDSLTDNDTMFATWQVEEDV